MTGFRWEIIEEYGPLFVDGALMTIKCTIICVILGTLWGLTLGLGRMAKAEHGPWKYILRYLVQFPVRFYVSAFRGTPLFVQIMVVHFALVPLFINPRDGLLVTSGLMSADFARELRASYGAFLSCIVAITLNAGAYVSEIFRAGIQSIDKGQMEASRALGMPWWKTMRKVILPQAFRGSVAPLGNTLIALLKNSTVAAAASVATETSTMMSEMIEYHADQIVPIFLIFAFGYVVLIIPIGMLTTYLSNKLAVRR